MATTTATPTMHEVCTTCGRAVNFHDDTVCIVIERATLEQDASHFPKGTAVNVSALPSCDICVYVDRKTAEDAERALYDGATNGGSWANMCGPHFRQHGTGLGIGRGQRLILVNG